MRAALLALAGAAVFSAAATDAPITFKDVTKGSGIRFTMRSDIMRGRLLATMGGGVAMGDFDGDGLPDLFFTGSAGNAKKPGKGPCGALYRNRGGMRFEDVTGRAGIHACGWTMGAAWVDLEGSGRLDLVVTGVGRTQLFRNRGDATFVEESERRGILAPRFAVGVAAGDVNGDGRVDLYLVDYLETTYEKEHAFPMFAVRTPDDYQGQDAFLFVQKEDGTFVDRTAEAGVPNRDGKGLAALSFDYDGDGKPDLYVTNDRRPNVLYRNRGDGTFEDVTVPAGAGARDMKEARAGMGVAVGDVDGDGRPDLVVTNFAGEPDTLYRNVEGQLFDDATESSGLARASFPYVQWGVDFADLDDDGRPDLVACSGQLVPRLFLSIAKLFNKGGLGRYGVGDRHFKQPPTVFRNVGEGRLEDVSATSGDMARVRLSARGLAAGDLDGDGRMDVVIAGVVGRPRVLRNTTASSGHALEILPVPGPDRRTALGTKVIVTAGEVRQTQEFVLRPSYASGSWLPLHFGLGPSASARVEVIPPGATSPAATFEAVAGDALYTLTGGRLTRVRAMTRAAAAP